MNSWRNNKPSKWHGFTLVELLAAMAIVGVIATLALPRYRAQVARARQAEAATNLSTIRDLQKTYYYEGDRGHYHSVLHYGIDKCGNSEAEGGNELGFKLPDCSKSRYRYITNAGNDCARSDGTIDQGQVYPGCIASDEWHMSKKGKLTNAYDVIKLCPGGGSSPSNCIATALPVTPPPPTPPSPPPVTPPPPTPPSPPPPVTPPPPPGSCGHTCVDNGGYDATPWELTAGWQPPQNTRCRGDVFDQTRRRPYTKSNKMVGTPCEAPFDDESRCPDLPAEQIEARIGTGLVDCNCSAWSISYGSWQLTSPPLSCSGTLTQTRSVTSRRTCTTTPSGYVSQCCSGGTVRQETPETRTVDCNCSAWSTSYGSWQPTSPPSSCSSTWTQTRSATSRRTCTSTPSGYVSQCCSGGTVRQETPQTRSQNCPPPPPPSPAPPSSPSPGGGGGCSCSVPDGDSNRCTCCDCGDVYSHTYGSWVEHLTWRQGSLPVGRCYEVKYATRSVTSTTVKSQCSHRTDISPCPWDYKIIGDTGTTWLPSTDTYPPCVR